MSKNKHERNLLTRFRKAGLKSNEKQVDAPFSFVISPTTTPGVDANESGSMAREFGNGIVENIALLTMQSPITGIVVFPRILDKNIAKIPDHLTHKRKEKAVFVGVNIDFDEWIVSSVARRIDILAETIVEALRRIAARHLLYPEDRDRLVHTVNDVRQTMISNYMSRTSDNP